MRETETPTQEAPAQSSLALIPTDTKRTDMKKQRTKYTESFKAAIVARINKGETAHSVARELKLTRSMLRRWVRQAKPGFVVATERGKAKDAKRVSTKLGSRQARYTDEFKRRAVARLANEMRLAVAKDLKVSPQTLTLWKGELATGPHSNAVINTRPYVRKIDKIYGDEPTDDDAPVEGHAQLKRNIQSCIVALRGIKSQINVADPVHLVAMVVLATLEGKM
jgi:transposase-like protein